VTVRPVATVFAVDPGFRTGLAVARLYPRDHASEAPTPTAVQHPMFHRFYVDVDHAWTAEFDDMPDEAARILQDPDVHTRGPLHIVTEHFQITRVAMQENATWSSEVIGMIRAARRYYAPDATLHTTQRPGDMKPLVHTPKVLQTLGLKRRGMTTHEADAVGHVLLFAARASNREVKL